MRVHVHIYNDLSSDYGTHVVVNFLSQVNFVFLLFFAYYGNESWKLKQKNDWNYVQIKN